MKMMLILILLVCVAAFAEDANEGFYRPQKIDTPPLLDGSLSDRCWQTTPRIHFIKSETDRHEPENTTDVMLCYDNNNLYIAWDCIEKSPEEILKIKTENDSDVWLDDCVEVFIAPDYYQYIVANSYYGFIINSIGTRADLKRTVSSNEDERRAWNGDWQAKSSILSDRWVLEVLIPFKTLGVEVEKLDLMGIAIGREKHIPKHQTSVWAIGGSFHKPSGHLLFGSYERYLANIYPIWISLKDKLQILESQGAPISQSLSDSCNEIIDSVETAKLPLMDSKNIRMQDLNTFLNKLSQSSDDVRMVERDIKFRLAMKNLKSLQ